MGSVFSVRDFIQFFQFILIVAHLLLKKKTFLQFKQLQFIKKLKIKYQTNISDLKNKHQNKRSIRDRMDKVDSIQSYRCEKHPQFNLELIQVNEFQNNSNKNIFYCLGCLDEDQSFQQQNYLLLSKIRDQGINQIIQKWPPLNDSSLVIKLQNSVVLEQQTLEEQINDFFDQLANEVMTKIQINKKSMMNLARQINDKKDEILQKYQNISKIIELRELIIDSKTDIKEKEKLLRNLIEQVNRDKTKNSKIFQEILNSYEAIRSQINLDNLNKSKETILSLIDSLNTSSSNQESIKNLMKQINNSQEQFLSQTQDKQSLFQNFKKNYQNKNQFTQEQEKNNSQIEIEIQNQISEYNRVELSFIQSKYKRFLGNYQFEKKDNSLEISVDNPINDYIQCYSDLILLKNKNYIFRFNISCQERAQFGIGLLRDSNKDNKGLEDRLACCLEYNENSILQFQNYGIQRLIKGRQFKVNPLKEQLELRVSIQGATLELTNYPTYDCKILLDDYYKNNLKKDFENFRLFITNNSNLLKITLVEAAIVYNFI